MNPPVEIGSAAPGSRRKGLQYCAAVSWGRRKSGASLNRGLGRGILTPAEPPLAMDGCLAEVPCLCCYSLALNYPNTWTQRFRALPRSTYLLREEDYVVTLKWKIVKNNLPNLNISLRPGIVNSSPKLPLRWFFQAVRSVRTVGRLGLEEAATCFKHERVEWRCPVKPTGITESGAASGTAVI